ncbi:helix-turn-helix domain-containing protein [Ornithinibacillus xuwenensis]|uniref:Helix-turn-helix transcriptional regulator n=1 Tax=Ornithinibacillus xuwenensis TaxID=3144668 RepID=A0ABU9XEY4_9BACI
MEKDELKVISELFGKELRKNRVIERDITQEKFARISGVGPEHIGEIERGIKLPRIETLLRLYKAGMDINRAFDHMIEELNAMGIDIGKE